jgi:hypothetical protein
MSPLSRALVAVVLVFACSAMPFAVDLCGASCEVAHGAARTATPSCHHAPSTGSRIGHAPTTCGHNHHRVMIVAAAKPSTAPRVPTVVSLRTTVPITVVGLVATIDSPSWDIAGSTRSIPLTLASVLRI